MQEKKTNEIFIVKSIFGIYVPFTISNQIRFLRHQELLRRFLRERMKKRKGRRKSKKEMRKKEGVQSNAIQQSNPTQPNAMHPVVHTEVDLWCEHPLSVGDPAEVVWSHALVVAALRVRAVRQQTLDALYVASQRTLPLG